MNRAILLLTFAVLTPCAVIAQAPNADDQMICRNSGEIGSRLARTRTCKTRAEWEEARREQRNNMDRAQTRQVNRTVDEKAFGPR